MAEEKMLKKFSKFAKEGYQLKSMNVFRFEFVQAKPILPFAGILILQFLVNWINQKKSENVIGKVPEHIKTLH
jgi:hypothetical protein